MANPRYQVRLHSSSLAVIGQVRDDRLSGRINHICCRYGVAINAAQSAVLSRLTDSNLHQIRAACLGWASNKQPAETLIGSIELEVQDAANGGDLDGENVSDTLAKLATLTPIEELALIEWLELSHNAQGD